ncbi:MAG: bifunctional phosphopantothenoylcysteine decarboxylase/phosphopantothenate--cysteine ligase CoaBC [Hydrogenothermaceae bacterium]
MLKGKNILVGVTGSIAAYKSCEIVRFFQKKGANVKVCMTPQATEFVGKLTFQALTNDRVFVNWDDGETGLEHITLARWADAFVIAPATANTIAKLRVGLADDFLTSLSIAYDKPIVIAPAMNTKMLENPATSENIEVLKERGYKIVSPSEGVLACGEEGQGKLPDIEDIYVETLRVLYGDILKGKKVLITAGGTREYFDPIRYISNASSGVMGYSLAKIAYGMGADVLLISAPTCLNTSSQIRKIDVVSAKDMYDLVIEKFRDFDIIIMNAAVADFRPREFSSQKLKKDRENLTVELAPNPDILKKLGEIKKEDQILVGFAAESENIIENAISKLHKKNLDVVVANPTLVFSKEFYQGTIIFKNGKTVDIETQDKEEASFLILKNIVENLT